MEEENYFSLAQEYANKGQTQEAIKNYKKALEENPASFAALFNLILQLRKTMSPELIEYAYLGLKLEPNNDNLYSILGEFYLKHGQKDYALVSFEEAHKIAPDNFTYTYNIATILYMLKNFPKAKDYFEELLEKDKDNISVLTSLAQTYKHLHDNQKALELHKRCYELRPDDLKIKRNLAITYNTVEQPEQALKLYEELLETDLDKIEVFRGIGIAYRKMHKYELALENFNKALEYNPDDLETMTYIADMYMFFEKEETTEMLIDQILKKQPDFLPAIQYKCILKLRRKDFSGFEYYRIKGLEFQGGGSAFLYKDKIWKGESLRGKTVLVNCNCGLGDSIMYARYIPELTKKAKKIIIEINKSLEYMFSENFPKCTIVRHSVNTKFDIMLNMQMLPYYLKAGRHIPKGKNSLKPDKDLVKQASKLEVLQTDKKKIAIAWRGSQLNLLRQITLKELEPLFDIDDTMFYSFQLDATEEEKEILKNHPNVVEMKDYVKDYSDTAAILTKMDRVISIDTSLIHMAGALGMKSYLILPFEQEWRWYGGKKNISPWYETVKMFRQTPEGSWADVVEEVKSELVRTLYNGKF
ncbi:tetratricopeptide repeat protein [bacterium]|nr:tetratricopeptide repeat protein [bacterium]